MAMARSTEFKTPMCRLSYASGLYAARPISAGGRELYTATLIFPKSDRPFFEKHIRDVIVAEWKDKGLEKAKAGLIRNPLLAGDGKEARSKDSGEILPGLGPDVFFIRVQAGKDRPPAVIWKDPNIQETETNVYSGCYGKAVLHAFAWHNNVGGDGVSFGIWFFQKLREGERLGGGGPIDKEKYYETVEDLGDAPPETKTGAGASGLFGE